MLLDKFVKTKWVGANKKYYEELSYKYTGINTDVIIDVKHLKPNSDVNVLVECDGCSKNIKMKYCTYTKNNRNGKYYCVSCANKLQDKKDKVFQIRLLNGSATDFESWAILNMPNVFSLWDYELNEVLPNRVSMCDVNEYYFKCPKELHESHKRSISSIYNNFKQVNSDNINCLKCNSVAQYLLDNYGDLSLWGGK